MMKMKEYFIGEGYYVNFVDKTIYKCQKGYQDEIDYTFLVFDDFYKTVIELSLLVGRNQVRSSLNFAAKHETVEGRFDTKRV